MNRPQIILSLLLLVFCFDLSSQKTLVWGTYSQAKFIYSPGLEAAYLFSPHIGVNLGAAIYSQHPGNKVANKRHVEKVSFLCSNLGFCSQVKFRDQHRFGAILGAKVYYGPDYKKLTYYEEGGYAIYFDQSHFYPEYGVDMGVFYSFRQYSILAKYDTARGKFRLGIGISLGKSKVRKATEE